MISRSSLFFFSEELQKTAGMPAPQQAPQPEKKKNFVTKHIGKGTLALGALGTAVALKNPAAASKYLGQMKQVVTNPKAALQRGFRSGASNIKSGPGAAESASKRVSQYKDSLRSALGYSPAAEAKALQAGKEFTKGEGKLTTFRSLDAPDSLRASGWGSVGKQTSEGSINLGRRLTKKTRATLAKLESGANVPEAELAALYQKIQGAAGPGVKMKKGLGYYMPGERGVMLGMGGGLGGTAGLETHDAETGRKRGIAERVARGTVGAAVGTMATPLFMGRGAGLSKANVFTGKGPSLLSQKTLLPLAGSTVALGGGAVAGEVAGKGGELADRAFGQKS